MDSSSSARRNGAFFLVVYPYSAESYEWLLKFNFDNAKDGEVVKGDDFPGLLSHNHMGFETPRTMKNDWTKMCTGGRGCMSIQEASLGTQNLKRLEKIHAAVDKHKLFQCSSCVGYGDKDEEEEDDEKNVVQSGLVVDEEENTKSTMLRSKNDLLVKTERRKV